MVDVKYKEWHGHHYAHTVFSAANIQLVSVIAKLSGCFL